MKTCCLFILLLTLPALLPAQVADPCRTCDCLLEKARAAAAAQDFESAIEKYNAAKVCDPARGAAIDEEVLDVFKRINDLRLEAKDQAELARRAQRRAEDKTREALANELAGKITEAEDQTTALQLAALAERVHPGNYPVLENLIPRYYAGQQALPVTYYGHARTITSVQISPDGQRLLTTSYDQTARLWNADTRQELVVFRGHTHIVWSAAFSPDGARIVTASEDRTARVWDSGSGRELFALPHDEAVFSAAFSPDGTRLVTAGADHLVRVWDVAGGRALFRLSGHWDWVVSAFFSPDGRQILSASHDGTARVWDVESQRELYLLSGHKGHVLSAAFSSDGRQVVTTATERLALVWRLEGGRPLAQLTNPPNIHMVREGETIYSIANEYNVPVNDLQRWNNRGYSDQLYEGTSLRVFAAPRITATIPVQPNTYPAPVPYTPDSTRPLVPRSYEQPPATNAPVPYQPAPRTDSLPLNQPVPYPSSSVITTPRSYDLATPGPLALAPVAILEGHTRSILSAGFSPDGQTVLTTSADGSARLWQSSSGKPIASFTDQPGWVRDGAFSPDGQAIYICTGNRMQRQPVFASAALVDERSVARPTKIAVSQNGGEILLLSQQTSYGQILSHWEPGSEQAIDTKGLPNGTQNDVVATRAGLRLILVDSFAIRVGDLSGAQATIIDRIPLTSTERALPGVPAIRAISTDKHLHLTPDGSFLVFVQEDRDGIESSRTIKGWDIGAHRFFFTLALPKEQSSSGIADLCFHQRDKAIVGLMRRYSQEDRMQYDSVVVWDVSTQQIKRRFPIAPQLKAGVEQVEERLAYSFSPDGALLMSTYGIPDGPNRTRYGADVWDVSTGQRRHVFRDLTDQPEEAHFSADGQRLLLLQTHKSPKDILNPVCTVWDLPSQQLLFRASFPEFYQLFAAGLSADGMTLAVGGGYPYSQEGKTVKTWRLPADSSPMLFSNSERDVPYSTIAVALSGDGTQLATAGSDGLLRRVDRTTRKGLPALIGNWAALRSVAFAPDGRRLVASAEDSTATVWDLTAERPLFTLKGHQGWVVQAAFSPDGRRIVTASYDGSARMWDAATGKELLRLTAEQGRVSQALFFPDGRRIVTAAGNAIIFWDAASGRELLTLRGHTQEVTRLDISPDGKRLVSVSDDQTVQVWTTAGQALFGLRGLTTKIQSARFSPDSRLLVTTSEDGAVQLWDTGDGKRLLSIRREDFYPLDVFFHPSLPQLISVETNRVRTWWIDTPSLLGEATQTAHFGFLPPDVIDRFDLEAILSYADITPSQLIARGKEEEMYPIAAYFLRKGQETSNPDLARPYYRQAQQLYLALEKIAHLHPAAEYRRFRELASEGLRGGGSH